MGLRFSAIALLLVSVGVLGAVLPTPLAGIFDTTPLLNAWHIAAGAVAAIAASRGLGTMRAWGQMLGYAFAVLSIAAFAADAAFVNGVLPLSTSNAWFHLALALMFLYYALLAPPTL